MELDRWDYRYDNPNGFTGNCFPGRCYAVPYQINQSFSAEKKILIRNQLREFELDTCIR